MSHGSITIVVNFYATCVQERERERFVKLKDGSLFVFGFNSSVRTRACVYLTKYLKGKSSWSLLAARHGEVVLHNLLIPSTPSPEGVSLFGTKNPFIPRLNKPSIFKVTG